MKFSKTLFNIKHGERSRSFSLKAAGQAASACGANVRRKLGLPSVQFATKQEAFGASLGIPAVHGEEDVNPNAKDYVLTNGTAQMNNGLLEIFFTAKKEEIRAIKIL